MNFDGTAWVLMQAGLNIDTGLNIDDAINDMSSCESDTAEDPSLRRSLRGAGRKSKVCITIIHCVLRSLGM